MFLDIYKEKSVSSVTLLHPLPLLSLSDALTMPLTIAFLPPHASSISASNFVTDSFPLDHHTSSTLSDPFSILGVEGGYSAQDG